MKRKLGMDGRDREKERKRRTEGEIMVKEGKYEDRGEHRRTK